MSYPLTNSELNTIRNSKQASDLYLALYEPNIVFQAQINDVNILKGAPDITYDNVITGAFGNIRAGMTLHIGSTPGNDDIGKVRIRNANSTIINVAQDDSILYRDNQYLTVREFYEFWPIFPRVILNDDELSVTYFKDYDISYTDQNQNLTPTPILGPDYAGFVNPTGIAIYFSATGSYVVDNNSSISSYAWVFPSNCVPSTSSLATPGNVYFPSAGNYTIRCTITAANGKSVTAYRHICLKNRWGTSLNFLPEKNWTLDSINGSEDSWIAKIKIKSGADKFKDGYLVFIFTEDFYNNIKQSIGGYYNREHILFIGYVTDVQNNYNYKDSETIITLKGLSGLIKTKEMYSVALEYKATPTNWTEIANPTLRNILDHYLRWHTTLYNIADVNNLFESQGSYYQNVIDVAKGEIGSNISDMIFKRLFANFGSDKVGRCYASVEPNLLITGSRQASLYELTKQDWLGDFKFNEQIEKPLSNVLLGGVGFDLGANISGTAYLSRAPGEDVAYVGKSESFSGLNIQSQDEINNLSGLYFAWKNMRHTSVDIEMSREMRNIDIFPRKFLEIDINSADLFRRTNWNNKRILPKTISYKLSNGRLAQSITFEEETYGHPGDTVIIPTTPPNRRLPRPLRPPTLRRPRGKTPTDGNLVYITLE